jgi:hypothetical protein
MVKPGTRLLESVDVTVATIEQLLTPAPTVSDKDSEDIGQKIRYLIDQTEAILAQTDIQLSQFRDALRGANTKDFSTLEADVESVLAKLDVALSTRASESTLSALNAKVQSESAGLFVKDVSVGTAAGQVDADTAYRDEMILLADSANTDTVYVGTSASQPFPLAAGASVAIRKTALNLIYLRAASGTQTIHVISGGA